MSGAVKPKAFAPSNGPPERDPVAVYKIYSEKRHDAMNKPGAPYFLEINSTKSLSSKNKTKQNKTKKCGLNQVQMGQNKLNSLMKTMAKKGGLSSTRLTITALENAFLK